MARKVYPFFADACSASLPPRVTKLCRGCGAIKTHCSPLIKEQQSHCAR